MNRRLLYVAIVLAAGCSSSSFTPAPPVDCSKTQCTCEQDPQQLTCRGFDGAEGGPGPAPHDGGGDVVTPDAEDAGADADDSGLLPDVI